MAHINLNGKHPVEEERLVDMADCASTSKQALKKSRPNSKIVTNTGITTGAQKADQMPAVNGPPGLEKLEPTKKPNTRLQKRLQSQQSSNGAHTATDQSFFLMPTPIEPTKKPNTRLQKRLQSQQSSNGAHTATDQSTFLMPTPIDPKDIIETSQRLDMADCALMNKPSTSKQALRKRGPNSKIIINAGTTTAPQKADPMPAVNGPPELEKLEPTKKPNTRLQKRLQSQQSSNGAHTATDQSFFLMPTPIEPTKKPNTRLQKRLQSQQSSNGAHTATDQSSFLMSTPIDPRVVETSERLEAPSKPNTRLQKRLQSQGLQQPLP
ncbi:uncharacterized protein LOC117572007 [Drosophila albomicans]|uniref:Uncharacterized protein LOC117572007 n=1 Tax=Drosophila albomicans TaxID=7291 RepID=A0A6P8YZP9_DROAB|nr:uncharacterized protein LOC117572007 [Drosophila albomicans]